MHYQINFLYGRCYVIYGIKHMLHGRKNIYHITKSLCLPYYKHMGDTRPQCSFVGI